MKKIISMLTISALALSSIFADSTVSLAFKQKGYITTNEGGTSKRLDLNGYNEKIKGDVVFKVANDTAGVVVDVVPYYTDASGGAVQSSSDFFEQYYGYVNFFDGALKLQSGVWNARSVNRLTQDAGTWEDSEYELFKYGVINGKVAKDITRFATVNGAYKGHVTTALTYTGENFYATGAVISNAFKSSSNELGTTETKSGFGLEFGLDVDEDTKIQAILKSTTDQTVAFAAFLDKKGASIFDYDFDFVAGVTLGSAWQEGENAIYGNGFEAAFDLRVRYEVSDTVAITSMNNISYLGNESNSNSEKGVVEVWDMVSVAVAASETLKVQLTGEWFYEDLTASDSGYFSLTPGVVYSPVKGTDITSGVIIKTYGWSHPTDTSIAIPFILRVAL